MTVSTGQREANGNTKDMNPKLKRVLLVFHCFLLLVGNTGGPLIMRLYFLHGGDKVWLSSFLETGGFPIIFVALTITYFHRSRSRSTARFFQMGPRMFLGAAMAGLLTGCDDYLFAFGMNRIPVSTSSLIIASQLVFTAVFAYLMVKQSFTPYSVNAVVLLTIGAGLLAMNTSSDLPEHESEKEYYLGFTTTVVAALVYGFVLPLVELIYQKADQDLTYSVVMEFQMALCFFATSVCIVGMLFHKDFQDIPREARESDLGEAKYYIVLVFTAIIWQCFFLGAVGVIFCASSLLSGIIIALSLPLTEVLAVVFYNESFQSAKAVSLVLSLWGFVSYFYGEMRESRRKRNLELGMDMDMDDQMYP